MRRPLGLVLVAVGVALLALAPLLRFYAYPALAKAPLDQDSQTVSVAPDATYLDIGALEIVEGATLTATRRVRGDVAAASDDRAVWDVFVKVVNDAGTLVTATTDRVAFDRSTSEAVNCCGESLNGTAAEHEGIEYKFPFGAEKKTYQYFDTTLGKASDMVYKGSEKVSGVSVYRYEQQIEPTKIAELDVPGTLIGRTETSVPVDRYYSNVRRVWVEPTTGVIVKGQEEQLSTLRDDTGQDVLTVTEATLTFDDDTVAEQAKTAKDNKRSLGLLHTLGPAVLGLLGLVLVLLGLVLALRRADGDDPYETGGARRHDPVAV
jgi:hypothetical protein